MTPRNMEHFDSRCAVCGRLFTQRASPTEPTRQARGTGACPPCAGEIYDTGEFAPYSDAWLSEGADPAVVTAKLNEIETSYDEHRDQCVACVASPACEVGLDLWAQSMWFRHLLGE